MLFRYLTWRSLEKRQSRLAPLHVGHRLGIGGVLVDREGVRIDPVRLGHSLPDVSREADGALGGLGFAPGAEPEVKRSDLNPTPAPPPVTQPGGRGPRPELRRHDAREARSSTDRKGRLAMIRLARPRPICFRDTSSSNLALLMSIAPDEFRASALVTSEGLAPAAGAAPPPPDPPSLGCGSSGRLCSSRALPDC